MEMGRITEEYIPVAKTQSNKSIAKRSFAGTAIEVWDCLYYLEGVRSQLLSFCIILYREMDSISGNFFF